MGQIFLNHTLSTADFMVRLEVACRDHGRIRLMEAQEILGQAPETTRRRKHPFGWQVAVQHNGERYTLGVIPDKLFGLHYLDQPDGRNRAYFFLEIDHGTMPVFRRSLHYKRTSFFVKLLAYYQDLAAGPAYQALRH